MKRGDRVRLIGIPRDAQDDNELQTRTLFEKCLGKIFVVADVESKHGIPFPLLRLDVGHVVGKAPYMETI